jgi:hypothetical protein
MSAHNTMIMSRAGIVAAWMVVASATFAGVETIPTGGRNIYRLVTAPGLIVGSTYDNRVCAFTGAGKHLWDAPTGGFVFDLAARDEIAAAGADGFVYLFGADGKLRWKHDLGAPVFQVAIAKLDGKTPVVLACGVTRELVALSTKGERLAAAKLNGAGRMMCAGDFDGDGAEEVAVLPIRGQAHDACFFKGLKLTQLKDKISSGVIAWDPEKRRAKDTGEGERFRKGKQTWSSGSLKKANGTTADLDGDGATELIYSPGVHSLKGGLRQLFALPDEFKTASYDQHYNMRLLAAGDLTGQPGAEIVLVEGPQVRLYDSTGKELGKAVAPFGFTDVVYLPGKPRGSVLLGSSPNGDDNIYRVTFEPGWEKALENIERRGVMTGIGANLKQLADAVASWRGAPMTGAAGPFDVVVNHSLWSGWDTKKFDAWIAEVRDYEKLFPYSRLRFATCFWPGEKAPLLRPDGKPWNRDKRLAHDLTREQIVAAAEHFETARCHFWVQVGHGCDPHLEVATVAAMLDAAPQTLLGFVSAEDEQLEEVPYYFEHHIKPILELCLKHKKRFIPRNKDIWWAHWPTDKKMREVIFNGRYRSVLLPSVEDSNSRCPEVNLAARVGLWLDGQVDDWASRCSADWFCAGRAWEWEYVMTGHPHLRYYVSQAMLGARVFMMLNGERERLTGRWTRVGAEGTVAFLHLLGKGALTPPRRDQLRAISPVALVMQQPSERFEKHGANGHHEEHWRNDDTDDKPWAFDRLDTYWAMAPLPSTDVATYLWGRARRDAAHVPATAPHGFVCLLPGAKPQTAGRWTSLWMTDGDKLSKDGKDYSLADARSAIIADFAGGMKTFPFRVEGQIFHQIIEQSPGRYVIVFVDPGWLNPAERVVTLAPQLSGNWRVTDRLSGAPLGNLSQPFTLRIPAGAFRLIEVSR